MTLPEISDRRVLMAAMQAIELRDKNWLFNSAIARAAENFSVNTKEVSRIVRKGRKYVKKLLFGSETENPVIKESPVTKKEPAVSEEDQNLADPWAKLEY
jgi:hypothetical protein